MNARSGTGAISFFFFPIRAVFSISWRLGARNNPKRGQAVRQTTSPRSARAAVFKKGRNAVNTKRRKMKTGNLEGKVLRTAGRVLALGLVLPLLVATVQAQGLPSSKVTAK